MRRGISQNDDSSSAVSPLSSRCALDHFNCISIREPKLYFRCHIQPSFELARVLQKKLTTRKLHCFQVATQRELRYGTIIKMKMS